MTIWFLLGQAGFASVGMLFWMAAAAIPIVLHLLKRRHRLVVPWAAMRLLQQVIQRQSRRARWQQWLLLALRTSIPVLLALALAGPSRTVQSDLTGINAIRSNKVWIFVVDTSYSMGYQSQDLTRLERAKQRISQLTSNSALGDAFALIVLEQTTSAGCDLQSALTITDQLVTNCLHDDLLPDDIEIVMLTDLGTDAWLPATGGSAAKLLEKLHRSGTLTIDSFTDLNPVNLAIEDVRLSSARAMVGNSLQVFVTIASYGQAVQGLPVQLQLGGQTVAEQSVDIGADQRKELRLQVRLDQSGEHHLSVSIPSDNLKIDNRVDRIVMAETNFRMLTVENHPKTVNPWQLALRPNLASELAPSPTGLSSVSVLQWSVMPTSQWDLLILDDIALGNSNSLQRLANFIQQGGAAIVALGADFSLPSSSGDRQLLRSLLGFELGQASEMGDWSIDPLEYKSPVIAAFAGYPNAGLLTTPIFRYWQVAHLDAGALVDLATTSGAPLIVRHPYGQGMVASILSAPEDGRQTASGESWNAITTWPSFLPLAQQLASSLIQLDTKHLNVRVGEALTGQAVGAGSSDKIILVRPDQESVELTVQTPTTADGWSWTYTDTNMQGIYRVGSATSTMQQFAANIDPVQSDMKSLEVTAIEAIASPKTIVQPESITESLPSLSNSAARIFLILLGLLLIAESSFAWLVGRQVG
jgi:hypothetical protein